MQIIYEECCTRQRDIYLDESETDPTLNDFTV